MTTTPSGPAVASDGRPSVRRRGRRGRRDALLFVAPLVVLLLVFVYAPIARLVYYAFTEYDGLRPPAWVGLDNFAFLADWPDFRRAIGNTVVLTLGVVVWVGLPFLLAVIIHGRRSANLVRAILFLPALLPALIVGRAFRLVLAEQGPINEALRGLGLGVLAQPWLASETWVLPTIIAVIAWATMGTGVLLYSAGLSSLSTDYVEAALVDGARWRQLVWHIYRPALSPVTRFWLLLLTIGTVTSFFPWILGLTQGGPGTASVTLDYQVYRSGVQTSRLGLASAIALVGVLVVAVLLAAQLLLRRLRGSEEW
ncbi:MAG: sugar ABC transporter permease [Chloroflexota bacterium]